MSMYWATFSINIIESVNKKNSSDVRTKNPLPRASETMAKPVFTLKLCLDNLPGIRTSVVHRLLKVEIMLRNIALLYGSNIN